MFEPAFFGQVPLRGTSIHLAGPSLGQEYWPDISRKALEKFERAQEEGAGDEELGVLWEAYQEALNAEMNWLRSKFNFNYRTKVPQGVFMPPESLEPLREELRKRITEPSPTPTPTPERPITRQDVPSVDCGPGRFWDGRQCRGSVAPGFGQFGNLAFQPGNMTTFAMSGPIRLAEGIGIRALLG